VSLTRGTDSAGRFLELIEEGKELREYILGGSWDSYICCLRRGSEYRRYSEVSKSYGSGKRLARNLMGYALGDIENERRKYRGILDSYIQSSELRGYDYERYLSIRLSLILVELSAP